MTGNEYQNQARSLCNLVNNRRAQLSKEPLRVDHIMRAVRFVLGPPPRVEYPYHQNSAWFWDIPIPYLLTRKAINFLIAERQHPTL